MKRRGLVHYYAPNIFSRGDAVDYCRFGKRCSKHISTPGRGARYTRNASEVTCPTCVAGMVVDTERVMVWPNCPVCKGTGKLSGVGVGGLTVCTACNATGKASVWNRETGEAM